MHRGRGSHLSSGTRLVERIAVLALVLATVVVLTSTPAGAAPVAVGLGGEGAAQSPGTAGHAIYPGADADLDGDGLTNRGELAVGTDPVTADTDGDGLVDARELAGPTDPNRADTDGDGSRDGTEAELGSDPTIPDTDRDGLADGREAAIGTDPTRVDSDRDGATDDAELGAAGTDPTSADTDRDGFVDGVELSGPTDPRNPDVDGDGLLDGVERAEGADPTDPDTDGDGLTDGAEVGTVGSDPAARDSDGDILTDRVERRWGVDPTSPVPIGTLAWLALGFVAGAIGSVSVATDRKPTAAIRSRLDGSEDSPAPEEAGAAGVEDETIPNEAVVDSLLRDRNGRMKQSAIIDVTGWSKAKVSRLLSTMADQGLITKIQLGRENLICLSGHEPDVVKRRLPA